MSRIACLLNVLMCLRAFRSCVPSRLCFLRAFLFWRALRVFNFWCSFIILPTYIFFMCFCFSCKSLCSSFFYVEFNFYVSYMLSFLIIFIFYVPSFFYVRTLYLRVFAFLIYLHVFYVSLCLLNALSFSRTFLVFIFLRALRCFNFSSQMPNKGGKGGIGWFFYFSQLLRRPLEL